MPSAIIQSLPTFPLYEYQSPKSNHQVKPAPDPLLLISPPLTASPHPWASSSAQCLRTQLLFLLARVPAVSYRTWGDEASVPGGSLPSLTLPSSPPAILASKEIRPWLDHHHPIYSPSTLYHGYPSPAAEAEARAFGRLVESQIYPAIMASNPSSANLSRLIPLLPSPPPPLAGLSSFLPTFIFSTAINSGSSGFENTSLRKFDLEGIKRAGVEAIKALSVRLDAEREESWFLGCDQPSPLDCLIVSHLYTILYSLDLNDLNPLRRSVKNSNNLMRYVERVMGELDGRRSKESGTLAKDT